MRALGLLLAIVLSAVANADSNGFALGVEHFDVGLNILESDSAAAILARGGVVRGLTRLDNSGRAPGYTLMLADSMTVNPKARRWSFRLRPEQFFPNGSAVRGADLKYSLERCVSLGKLPLVRSITVRRSGAPDAEGAEEWLDLEAANGPTLPTLSVDLPRSLSNCPTLEASSSAIFGAELGLGSSFVSAGPFTVTRFKKNEIELARYPAVGFNVAASETVTIRGFDAIERSISALRLGTIDAFLTRDQNVAARVKGDETLLSSACSGYIVFRRRGFTFDCHFFPDLETLAYAR